MEIKPGCVVKSRVVGVDFGKLTYKPGDYGIVCDVMFAPMWFNVHWGDDYQCTVADTDVILVLDHNIARIQGGEPGCAYCNRERTRRRRWRARKKEAER